MSFGIRYPVGARAFWSYGRLYKPGELIHIGLKAAAPLLEAGLITTPSADDLRQQVVRLVSEREIHFALLLLDEAERYYPGAFGAERKSLDRVVIADRRKEFRQALADGDWPGARFCLQDLRDLCAERGESCADELAAYAAASAVV